MTDTPTPIEIIKALDHAMDILHDIYGSPGAQVIWLTSEQRLLDDRVPLDMIKNGETQDVISLLTNIAEGAYT